MPSPHHLLSHLSHLSQYHLKGNKLCWSCAHRVRLWLCCPGRFVLFLFPVSLSLSLHLFFPSASPLTSSLQLSPFPTSKTSSPSLTLHPSPHRQVISDFSGLAKCSSHSKMPSRISRFIWGTRRYTVGLLSLSCPPVLSLPLRLSTCLNKGGRDQWYSFDRQWRPYHLPHSLREQSGLLLIVFAHLCTHVDSCVCIYLCVLVFVCVKSTSWSLERIFKVV